MALILADGSSVTEASYLKINRLPQHIPVELGFYIRDLRIESLSNEEVVLCLPIIQASGTVTFNVGYIPIIPRIPGVVYIIGLPECRITCHADIQYGYTVETNRLEDIPSFTWPVANMNVYMQYESDVEKIVEFMKRFPKCWVGNSVDLFTWNGQTLGYTTSRMADTPKNRLIANTIDTIDTADWQIDPLVATTYGSEIPPEWVRGSLSILTHHDMSINHPIKIVQDGTVHDFIRAVRAVLAMSSARYVPRVGTRSPTRILTQDIYRLLLQMLAGDLRYVTGYKPQ